ASCTLDGCVKVYTSRVDSIETETGKLLSGLLNSSKNNDENDRDDDFDLERRTRKKEFSVDPLFTRTSADFDEGGARVDRDCKIIFDASDAILYEIGNDKLTTEDYNQPKIDITKHRCGRQQSRLDYDDDDGIDREDVEFNRNDDDEGVDRNDHDEGLNRDHDDEGVGNNYDVSGVFDEDDINPHTRLTEKDFVMAMVNNKNELFSYLILRFYVTGQVLNIGS
ncbi:13210_t:CDS:2, partial [Funneliformis caledonium]